MRGFSALAVFLFVGAVSAFAQSTDARAIVLQNAPIMLYPDASRQPLRVAAPDTSLRVLGREGDWLQVQFQDPQYGLRTGYVQVSLVRMMQPENLRPINLSVPPATSEPPQQGPTDQASRPAPAQRSPRSFTPSRSRVVLDAGYLAAIPMERTWAVTGSRTVTGGSATAAVLYGRLPVPQGIDSGVMFGGWPLDLGVRWTRAKYSGLVGAIALRVPFGVGVDAATGLDRTDDMIDGQVGWSMERPAMRLSVFGGPTAFRVSQDMVSSVGYVTFLGLARVTSIGTADVTGWTFGGNGGADLTWFFSKHVGVGGGGRVNYGRMGIEEPIGGSTEHFRVGYTMLTVGPRFRF